MCILPDYHYPGLPTFPLLHYLPHHYITHPLTWEEEGGLPWSLYTGLCRSVVLPVPQPHTCASPCDLEVPATITLAQTTCPIAVPYTNLTTICGGGGEVPVGGRRRRKRFPLPACLPVVDIPICPLPILPTPLPACGYMPRPTLLVMSGRIPIHTFLYLTGGGGGGRREEEAIWEALLPYMHSSPSLLLLFPILCLLDTLPHFGLL